MSRGTVEIPVEIWELCQQDAERMAYLHKECVRLAAEVERMRKAGDAMTYKDLNKQVTKWVSEDAHNKLKAENERLRMAGDAMHAAAVQDSTGLWLTKPFEEWAKAKEGGSK